MSKTASKDVMSGLHSVLAEKFKELLEGEELPQASTLNVIRQFLKDNGIETAVGTNDTLEVIAKKTALLPFPTGSLDNKTSH